jgi:hypothetical protein
VVVQVEPCELVVMVGYRPGTGESTEAVLARAANSAKPLGGSRFDSLRDVLATYAMAPLTIAIDGTPLAPTTVRAKVGLEPGGARPMVVVLVTYALHPGQTLSVASHDPKTTRISWQDRTSSHVDLDAAPAQDHWFDGVASFLLKLSPSWGSFGCATPSSQH